MQELVILAGLPGSGKSVLAKKLKVSKGLFVISSDALRLALNAGIYPRSQPHNDYAVLDPVVWVLAEEAATLLLKAGQSVAIDATNLTKARRARWREVARASVPTVRVSLVWCTGNYDSPSRWQEERGHSPEEYWDIRRQMEAKVEPPSADEASELRTGDVILKSLTDPT